MQILDLHCIFMVLYKTISIFPLASLVVLYVFTFRNISIHILTNIDLNLVANVMKKNENLQYYIIEKIRR